MKRLILICLVLVCCFSCAKKQVVIPKEQEEIKVKIIEETNFDSTKELIKESYIYIVEKKDCLWDIADKICGNPFLWKEIYEINKRKILHPDLIYQNQILIIPKNLVR